MHNNKYTYQIITFNLKEILLKKKKKIYIYIYILKILNSKKQKKFFLFFFFLDIKLINEQLKIKMLKKMH